MTIPFLSKDVLTSYLNLFIFSSLLLFVYSPIVAFDMMDTPAVDRSIWLDGTIPTHQLPPDTAQVFTNTGGPQIYVVPEGVYSIEVELYGSKGTVPQGVSAQPGKGGIVKATIAVTPGEVLQFMVGDAFGFNGGTGGGGGATGGGATDIRRPDFSTESSCAYTLTCPFGERILVAGGGGAAGSYDGSHGGDGGENATAGTSAGTGSTPGGPGTATAGGAGGTNSGGGAEGGAGAGLLGSGGILGWKPDNYGGGGGGGYYGGGGGGGATGTGASGGGGGSSWAADTSEGVSNVVFIDGMNDGEGKIIVNVPSAIPNAAFAFTGSEQGYRIDDDVTDLAVMIAGARGASAGDVVFGRLPVTPGDSLVIVLGGAGESREPAIGTGVLFGGKGGYNGGGDSESLNFSGYGGGGASDLRVAPYDLQDRVIVAGGGGGVNGFLVQYGWFGAKGGDSDDGAGGNGKRNSTELQGQGGQLNKGGVVLENCHVECEVADVDTLRFGRWLYGGDATAGDIAGGGGGYYGGAAHHGGGGGSSYATVSGPDPTRQGVGNVLGQDGAMIAHTRGTNVGDGYAVLTAMPIATLGAATTNMDSFLFSGTINPKYFACKPILYLDTSKQEILYGRGQLVTLKDTFGNELISGNYVQPVSGFSFGASTPQPEVYYFRVCAQTVAGLSCSSIDSITTGSFSIEATVTTPACEGSPVTLSEISGDENIVSWVWTGPGGFSDTGNSLYIPSPQAGDYVVVATTSSNLTASDTVTVYPSPGLVAKNDGPHCEDEILRLFAIGGDCIAWEWYFPSGFVSCLQNPVASPVNDGEHIVIGTSIHGCKSRDTTIVNVSVPSASCLESLEVFLPEEGTSSVSPEDIDNGSAPGNYFGIQSIQLAGQTEFSCQDIGQHPVTLLVEDSLNCTANCSSIIAVIDTTPPSSACQSANELLLLWSGTEVLPAAMIHDSDDNCEGPLLYSFTPDFNTHSLTVNCREMLNAPLDLMVYIQDASGNVSSCIVSQVFPPSLEGENCWCDQEFIQLSGQISPDDYTAQKTINADGQLFSNDTVRLKAEQSITLSAGFSAPAGSFFAARIDSCAQRELLDDEPSPIESRSWKNPSNLPEESLSVSLYPNPFQEHFSLDLDVSEQQTVTIKLFRMTGHLVSTLLSNTQLNKGLHHLTVDGSRLPPGVHLVEVCSGESRSLYKMIKL